MSDDMARKIDPEAMKVADEASSAAAILEQQISETMPDMPADLRGAMARLGVSIAKKSTTQAELGPEQQTATAQIVLLPI